MQVETAYANGIGLREIARNMDIPEGTVLSRAKREGWMQQIQSAKALSKRDDALGASPVEAAAMSMRPTNKNNFWNRIIKQFFLAPGSESQRRTASASSAVTLPSAMISLHAFTNASSRSGILRL